jgi:predicted metal-binding membrane protein
VDRFHAYRTGALPWLVALSAVGFAASLTLPWRPHLSALCGSLGRAPASLDLIVGPQWSPAAVVAEWLIMLIAMMSPLLAQPVTHVWRSSLVARRPRALILFALAYAMVWLTAAGVLVPCAMMLRLGMPDAAPIVAVALAIGWSGSPYAQLSRNRCHRSQGIGAFGRSADRDCLRQGVATGLACVGTCWPWMLVPMMLDAGHAAAMVAVSLVLFLERLAPPAPAAWRLPAFVTVAWAFRPSQKALGT